MSAEFVRAVLRDNPLLFRLMVRFNQHPALTAHADSWPSDINVQLRPVLLANPASERRLSEMIARQASLSPNGYWEFEEPPRRLALLDGESLLRLTKLTGAAVLHPALSAIIGGTALRDIKTKLGDDVHHFAVKRAPLLFSGPRPTVPSSSGNDLVEHVLGAGRTWLSTCLGADSPELLRRVAIKLPSSSESASQASVKQPSRESAWKLMKRIVATEIHPELAACFN